MFIRFPQKSLCVFCHKPVCFVMKVGMFRGFSIAIQSYNIFFEFASIMAFGDRNEAL